MVSRISEKGGWDSSYRALKGSTGGVISGRGYYDQCVNPMRLDRGSGTRTIP